MWRCPVVRLFPAARSPLYVIAEPLAAFLKLSESRRGIDKVYVFHGIAMLVLGAMICLEILLSYFALCSVINVTLLFSAIVKSGIPGYSGQPRRETIFRLLARNDPWRARP